MRHRFATQKEPYVASKVLCGITGICLIGLEVNRCERCDEDLPTFPNMNGLFRVLANAVACKPGFLCEEEDRFLRKWVKMETYKDVHREAVS
jgi:hypothetical protein